LAAKRLDIQTDEKAIVQPPKLISRRAGWAWVACQFLLIAALMFAPALPTLHAPHFLLTQIALHF
jgi:hypothetical protein